MKFNKIFYRHNSYGNIEIVFTNSGQNVLYFDGGYFYNNENNQGIIINKLWNEYKLDGEIIEVRQTNDFDFILKLRNDDLIKIFFMPNSNFDNGVEQQFSVYNEDSNFYPNVLEDFNLYSSKLDF